MALTELKDGKRTEMTPQAEADYLAFQAGRTLQLEKIELRAQFVDEAIVRVRAVWPQLEALFGDRMIEGMDFVESLVTHGLLSFTGADAGALLTRDIRDFVKSDAVPLINAIITQAELDAVDPLLAEPFGPGGPAWPV